MTLETIYKEKNTFPKPETLIHFTHNEGLKHMGMVPASNWSSLDEFINRPSGIFFWNAEQEKDVFCSGIHKVFVDISDLDTSKLFAYPVAVADIAERFTAATEDQKFHFAGLLAEMKQVKAVSFNDYDGSFFAEWIYTGDIEADIIK